MHCFHLKMADKEVERYADRLQLLAQGKLSEAAAVSTGGAKAAETAKGFAKGDDLVEDSFDMQTPKQHGKSSSHDLIRPAPLDGKPDCACINNLIEGESLILHIL